MDTPFDWSATRNPAWRKRYLGRIPREQWDDSLQDACVKLANRTDLDLTLQLIAKTAENCWRDSVKAERRRRNRENPEANGVSKDDDARSVARRRAERCDNACSRHGIVGFRGRHRVPIVRGRDEDRPSFRLELRDRRGAIKRAVRKANLSREHRCALWAWMRGRVAEFAKRSGFSESTVRVWAYRACRAIRPFLEQAGLG